MQIFYFKYVRLYGDDPTFEASSLEELEAMFRDALFPKSDLIYGEFNIIRFEEEIDNKHILIITGSHCAPGLGRNEAVGLLIRAHELAPKSVATWRIRIGK